MTDGLKGKHRTAIVAAIAANDWVERAVLFGSRATRTNTATSDVDIALFGDRLTLTDQARLGAAIDEISIAQSVDLVLHNSIDNPALREHIRAHGVEWYRRPNASEAKRRPGNERRGMSDRLHLSACHRETLELLLGEHLSGVEVWAYGSRVNGRSHDGSDLDLVLRDPQLAEIDISRIADFIEALQDSTIPFLVEARDWARLPESFHREIEREHVVLVEREAAMRFKRSSPCLDDVANFLSGGTPKKGVPDFWDGDIPWFSASNMNQRFLSNAEPKISQKGLEAGSKLAPKGATLLLVRGSGLFNRIPICFADQPVAFNQDVKAICAKPGIDPVFLHFWIESLRPKLCENIGVTGIGAGKFDLDYLKMLPFPDISEQQQKTIRKQASVFDRKIELNRRMNQTLEAMARALFKSWFVDFDPVRAKMAGRDTGLPKEIADLFPDRLVESELGEIPEGWPLVPLPELIEVNPSRSLRRGEIAPYLDMANMPTHSHAPDSVVQRLFKSGMRFAKGDTLVARITPCLENGKTAYVDFLQDGEIGWGSTEYIVMKSRHPLPGEFAYLLARSARFRGFAFQNMSGTSGRQRVPAAALSGFLIPSPPAVVGAEFGRAIRLFLGRARAAADECRVLANCRDDLLPKLVSGEMRVNVHATRLAGYARPVSDGANGA